MRLSEESARRPLLGAARPLGGIIALWTALVVCCAWPAAQAIAPALSSWERAGMAAAVAVWIGVTAWLYERRRRASNPRAAVPMALAAALYAIVQGVINALVPSMIIVELYAPSAMVASRVLRVLVPESAPDPLWTFALTLACGGQVLLCVLAIARVLAAASGRLSRVSV